MALYSLVIERGGKSYSTQLVADSATNVISKYFTEDYPQSGIAFFGESAPRLTTKDIIYIIPMEGLVNIWIACAGQEGEYVSIICSRTVSHQAN